MDNPCSKLYDVANGIKVCNAYVDSSGYFFLIPIQNLLKQAFLKVSFILLSTPMAFSIE